jgi:hypothetical protein
MLLLYVSLWKYWVALISITLLADDVLIPTAAAAGSKWAHVLSDTSCHEITALILWCIYREYSARGYVVNAKRSLSSWPIRTISCRCGISEPLVECAMACMFGSLVDIDHFVSARSLSLFHATHLSSRPFGHAVLFVVAIFAVLRYLIQWNDISMIYLIASISHLVRDSSRRGLWMWPFPHTPPIPYSLHLLLLLALPYIGWYIFGYPTSGYPPIGTAAFDASSNSYYGKSLVGPQSPSSSISIV